MVTKKMLTVLLLILVASATALATAQQPTLDSTQNSLYNSYKAILDAYNAGANTNQLTDQLNQALNLTSQAQQLITTNPQQAEILSSQAQAIAQNITQQAITAQQSATTSRPVIAIGTAIALITTGILTYCLGPKVLWKFWFKLRKNYRIKTKTSATKNSGLIITAEQLCAIILGFTVIVAFFSVSGSLLPKSQNEHYSELGILGENMQLGNYPSQIVASETIHLSAYVGNQMSTPIYYIIMVKLGNNDTQVNPAPLTPIQQFIQIIPVNQTWSFPVNITLTKAGLNQRIIFELWTYNATLNQNQYSQRWGQIWLNVTAPVT
jgi:uncharacterized membrane protein